MSSEVVLKENTESKNGETLTNVDVIFDVVTGSALTYMPVLGMVIYAFSSLVEKLPHNTLSDTKLMAGSLLTASFVHVALGKVIDKMVDHSKNTGSKPFLGKNAVAALVLSGGVTVFGMAAHVTQKAEQFHDMQISVARECFNDKLPKGTEVIRHRYADGFYVYECPSLRTGLGAKAMPTGPVRS